MLDICTVDKDWEVGGGSVLDTPISSEHTVMSELRHAELLLQYNHSSYSSSGSEGTGQALDSNQSGLEELKPE